jgi:hypothetical protein
LEVKLPRVRIPAEIELEMTFKGEGDFDLEAAVNEWAKRVPKGGKQCEYELEDRQNTVVQNEDDLEQFFSGRRKSDVDLPHYEPDYDPQDPVIIAERIEAAVEEVLSGLGEFKVVSVTPIKE